MTRKLDPPLAARNGRVLEVLLICRVSNPAPGKQDERSLDDQQALHQEWLKERAELPFNVTEIAGSGSGEHLDREEATTAQNELESGKYDLVLTEDLGRIFRRMHAYLFCEAAEDVDTRVIAPNDLVDTAQENWRLCAFFAALRHEMYNADTAKRIRRTLRNRFQQGGIFQCAIFGYIKPRAKASDSEVSKDPAAEAVYDEWFSMLEKGASFAEVADWLNALDVPTGPYCSKNQWDGTIVGRVTRNPILKGMRVRNDRMSRRINRTGRRKSVKTPPKERLERECPHLAFVEPNRYDRVIRILKERNDKYRRNGHNGRDPRKDIPKRRTRFPGQVIECGICGHGFVFGGHGQTDHLMCHGAREHKCWNGITADGPLSCERISSVVFREIESLEGFDPAFLELVEERERHADGERGQRLRTISTQLARNTRELANIANFVRRGDDSLTIREELQRLEREKAALAYELTQNERQPADNIVIPEVDELRQLGREAFQDLTADSFEFARLMCSLIPIIVVWPYRLCDGGHIVLRAKFRLRLANLVPNAQVRDVLAEPLERILTVDLFHKPQREAFRKRVVAMRAIINAATGKKYTEAEVARELEITKTAAQRAASLQRKMDELGIADPYQPVIEPPNDYPKLRRHKHSRYHFEPLDNAGEF